MINAESLVTPSPQPAESLAAQLASLGESARLIDRRLYNLGFGTRTLSLPALERYQALPGPVRAGIAAGLAGYARLLAGVEIERPGEVTILEEQIHLKWALTEYGWHVKDDTTPLIKAGDIVELYDTNAIQAYRNLNFFRLCRYTLLDLSTHEWFSLYYRPEKVTELMLKSVDDVMRGSAETLPFGGGSYLLKERMFHDNRIYQLENRTITRVYDGTGAPVGVLTVLRAERLVN